MAQAKKQVELNNFSGGFNTEQSPLNADPSTTIQEQNMILASDGSRARRYGYNSPETAINGLVVAENERLIPPVAKFSKISVETATAGVYNYVDYSLIYNYNPEPSPSYTYSCYESSGTDITSSSNFTLGSLPGLVDFDYQYTQVGSQLLIPNGISVIQATPSDGTNPLEAMEVYLSVRDLWGLDDGLKVTERPVTLTNDHAYNLLNQGWTAESMISFKDDMSVWPSNADVPYFGKVPTDYTGTEVYSDKVLKEVPFKEGAPKGKIRLSVYNPDNSRRSGYVSDEFVKLNASSYAPGLVTIAIGGGSVPSSWLITSATSYLGRVFYTGQIEGQDYYGDGTQEALGSLTPSFNNALMFSKIVSSDKVQGLSAGAYTVDREADIDNPFMCHSKIDPTSEYFAPTASDGGILFVTGADRILCTVTTRNSLLIVATNGVWELQALDGFSPSTFNLVKITSASINSQAGVVTVDDKVFVPTSTGLLMFYYDGNTRRSISSNISDATIRRFFTKYYTWIQDVVYDEGRQEVRWLMSTPPVYTDGSTLETIQQLELVLDIRLGAYSVNMFSNTQGIVQKQMFSFFPVQREYWTRPLNADLDEDWRFVCRYLKLNTPYVDGSMDTAIDLKRNTKQVKLLVAEGTITSGVAVYKVYGETNGVFIDFGVTSVESYLVSNPMTLGDTIRRKDINYLWTHFYRTEDGFEDDGSGDWIPTNPSGCLLSVRWDFSDDASSGKWSVEQQVYKYQKSYMPVDINDPFTYGQNILTTKNNITGSGKALSIKIASDGDKDLQLVGWGSEIGISGAV